MRQPMEIRLAGGCVRSLRRNGVERPEHVEERCAEHRRPRNRIDGVGNGVANPGEGAESLLEVGGRQGRTESNTGPFESIEVGRLGTVERKVGVAADGDEVKCSSRHRKGGVSDDGVWTMGPGNSEALTRKRAAHTVPNCRGAHS